MLLSPGLLLIAGILGYLLATEPLFFRAASLISRLIEHQIRSLFMRASIEAYVIGTKIDPSAQMQMAREICRQLEVDMPEDD